MPVMMGALSQTDEPDGGYSPDMLREMYLKAQRPNEGLSTAYARMADALKASRGPATTFCPNSVF